MNNFSETLARNEERLERLLKSQPLLMARARRLKRRTEALIRRLARMVGGATLVAVIAFVWGLVVGPIGFSGVALTMLTMIAVFFFLAFFPREPDIAARALPETPLNTLPAQVEDWLALQRRALPAPSRNTLDHIIMQIDGLTPDLQRLTTADPRAADAQRLLSDHLPRLVQSYTDVPERLRVDQGVERQLQEGLDVVRTELDRLSRDLGRDRLDAFEVEGRFLETRYRPKPDNKI